MIVFQGQTQFGNRVECACGKAGYGDWDDATLSEIAQEHLVGGHCSMIQSAKNVVSGDRSNWCPDDDGFPWGTRL